jgi:DNA helicase II / ATP-dependent DNA helicase PcrA
VGDEDQSIYSWRGADIRNILEFEQRLSGSENRAAGGELPLDAEHSGAASAVVANNVRRKGKNLWTSRQGGAKIGYYEAPDGENEALFAADTINRYVRRQARNGETARAAVLYRTNSQSRLFEEAMRRYQLKYHVVGGFSFYERAEIKDLISYLKVIQNPDDSVSLLRVINTPVRGIGKTTIEMIEQLALETGIVDVGRVGRGDHAAVVAGAGFGGAEELSRFDRGRARDAGRDVCWSGWMKRTVASEKVAPAPSCWRPSRRPHPLPTAVASAPDSDTDFDPVTSVLILRLAIRPVDSTVIEGTERGCPSLHRRSR